MTSHVQSQHVSVTTTTSTSNHPLEKGAKSRQTFMFTQPGPITSAVDSSQYNTTVPSYPYTGIPKVQWSQPLQCSYDHEQATSMPAPNNQQVTYVSSSLSNDLSISRPISSVGIGGTMVEELSTRRGKAPPIDLFTAESIGITFDDWLLTLERAAIWNGWTSDEALMQLSGHLKGRALQEWKLLTPDHKTSYQTAIKALREKLDPGNQTLAALDFHHTVQKAGEPVSDFIGCLEQIFQTGFGREHLSHETRDMLLYGQLRTRKTTVLPNGITCSVWCPELQGIMCCSQERGEKTCRAPEEATVLEGTKYAGEWTHKEIPITRVEKGLQE